MRLEKGPTHGDLSRCLDRLMAVVGNAAVLPAVLLLSARYAKFARDHAVL